MGQKIIAHLDMDAFFASVEEIATPRFLGKPIVVGSEIINGRGRGVVSTANYKAREYGIHSAMPITAAWRLSQDAKKSGKEEAIFLPVDFALYRKVSAHVLEIIKNYWPQVEQASVDEFYFDVSAAGTLQKACASCQNIKDDIKKAEKITCSVGIAPNKMIAKIAAGTQKPNGLVCVAQKDLSAFLNPLPIRELPGVGPKTAELFYRKNMCIIADLLPLTKEDLQTMLGKHGEKLHEKIRGIDNSLLAEHHQAKSIGEQTTFTQNSLEPSYILDSLKKLSDSVFNSFIKSDFTGFKTLTITVRFADFEKKTSSKTVASAIGKTDKKKFEIEIVKLILPFLDQRSNPRQKLLRLVGIRIEKIV